MIASNSTLAPFGRWTLHDKAAQRRFALRLPYPTIKPMKPIILITALILSACATTPVPYATATPVTKSNFLEGYAQFTKPSPGTSRVVVVRDSGMLGAASPAKLSIDGVPVAKLWSSERLELFLPPATYIFGVEPAPRLMGALVETTYEIKSDKSYGFRIALDSSGVFSIQQSTQIK